LRGATGQNVTLWDTQAGTPIHSFARTYQGSMSPDGRYILTYGEQQGFVLWDAHNYSYVRSFVNADNSPAVWFEFSGDSRYVLVESLDQLVSLWGVNTGSKLHTFDRDILSGWFLPNSEAILTFGYATQENQTHYQVWNAKTLREQFRFDGPFPELLRLSPDGRFVIIESSDLELSMWSLQTGRKVRQFCG
jgi:WD40 repeat protein